MNTLKKIRFAMIIVLCLTLPIRQVFASMPEIRPLAMDTVNTAVSLPAETRVELSELHFVQHDPVLVDGKVIDAILGTEEEVIPGLPTGLTIDNAEEQLQDELLIPGHERSGLKHKLIIGATLLLAASLIVALLSMLGGGGSGAGSGSGGNGGSGGGAGGSDVIIPLFGPLNDENNDGASEDGNGNSFNKSSFPSNVPNNPEPTSMLLTLLGLGLPFLRKRLFS